MSPVSLCRTGSTTTSSRDGIARRRAIGNLTISIARLLAAFVLKAVLISIAAFVSFDAIAWHGALRVETARQVGIAVQEVEDLDWSWG